MDNKFGGQGTTLDGDTGQTRELMHDTAQTVVPKLSHEMQMARGHLTAIPDERKREIESESKRKISFMEAEYWKMRNETQDFMRCPFCVQNGEHRLNFEDQPFCCVLFAKAFGAILDRQNQVDIAAQMVRTCHKVGLVN